MKSPSYHYRRWIIQAPVGLVLIGMGLCFVVEAGLFKFRGAPTWQWVAAGTLALVVVNAGISLFGDAVLQRVRYERLKEHPEERAAS